MASKPKTREERAKAAGIFILVMIVVLPILMYSMMWLEDRGNCVPDYLMQDIAWPSSAFSGEIVVSADYDALFNVCKTHCFDKYSVRSYIVTKNKRESTCYCDLNGCGLSGGTTEPPLESE